MASKIDKKYIVLVPVMLFIACLTRNAYEIYRTCLSITSVTPVGVVLTAIKILALYGVAPMAIVFVCAFAVWRVGIARYVNCVPLKEFCCLTMACSAVAKFVVGIINIFSILDLNVSLFCGTLDFLFPTVALLVAFFWGFCRLYRINPVEKYNAYKLWFSIYMAVCGIGIILQNGIVILLSDGSEASLEVLNVLYQFGYMSHASFSPMQIVASVVAICVYLAVLAAVVLIGEKMRKQMKKFRDPDTRAEFYESRSRGADSGRDAASVFSDDFVSAGDDKRKERRDSVFDEFDI